MADGSIVWRWKIVVVEDCGGERVRDASVLVPSVNHRHSDRFENLVPATTCHLQTTSCARITCWILVFKPHPLSLEMRAKMILHSSSQMHFVRQTRGSSFDKHGPFFRIDPAGRSAEFDVSLP